jgi:bisanhydrobacterioruberin hydratase
MNNKIISRQYISIIILIIVNLVGVVGLSTSYRDTFLLLTPLNLLLAFSLVLLNEKQVDGKYALFFIFSFLTGIVVEVLGVQYGLIFGDYHYGKPLGIKFSGVPLVIGLNWFLLVYGSASLLKNVKGNLLVKAFLGALLMTGVDFFIEPVAINLGFWLWDGAEIPFSNYLGWFVISFILHLVLHQFKLKLENKVAAAVFLVIALFFVILNFTL